MNAPEEGVAAMTAEEAAIACEQDPEWTMMALGVIIFWVIMLIVFLVTMFMHKGDKADWYKRVFLYGAYELADIVASKSDELRDSHDKPAAWWKPIFCFWWAFSIKYFVPWALLSLMMWNFKADITFTNGLGYGAYHSMWQVVGFIYPLIGLVCFIVPICIVTTPEKALTGPNGERIELDLNKEEHPELQKAEQERLAKLEEEAKAALTQK